MSDGYRTYGDASLLLAKPDGLPTHMRGPVMELCDFRSRSPGKGHAETLLRDVAREADQSSVVLILHCEPEVGMDRERLQRMYQRHGFQVIQASPLLMARPIDVSRHSGVGSAAQMREIGS